MRGVNVDCRMACMHEQAHAKGHKKGGKNAKETTPGKFTSPKVW